MARYFFVVFALFVLLDASPSVAQQTFTIFHDYSNTQPGHGCPYTCNDTGFTTCISYTETWTLDTTVIFGSNIINGTYKNTAGEQCQSFPNNEITEQFFFPPNLNANWDPIFGNDGPCPHTFPFAFGNADYFLFCWEKAVDTVNYQLQLDTSAYGMSDPQSNTLEDASTNTVLFNMSYIPDQSAEMGPCTQCQAQAGAPINVISGNTWIQQQDYSLPGLGGGIEITRTWNSTWGNNQPPKQVGMFGDGWTSSYEESLTQSGTGLKYWSGAGTAWTFTFNSSTGTYSLTTPSDERATLVFDSTVSQYTLTLKDGRKRIFDSNGRLLKQLDRNANAATLSYDTSGRLSAVTDAAGRIFNFSYADPSNVNQVTQISDSVGPVATYSYAPNGVLSSVLYPDGSGFNFTSDSANLVTSVTDTAGKTVESHTYDSVRRGLTSSGANNANSVSISYTGTGTSQLTDSLGNVSSYAAQAINHKHYITSTSGPGCATCGAVPGDSYTYDSQGNIASKTDAAGHKTSYTYDSNANLTSSSIAVGSSTVTYSYTYNSFGEILTATDPLQNVTTNTYDANGNLLTTTTPSPGGKTAGSKTSFAYDTKGELTQITDPLKNITTIAYTPAGLVSTITDSLNNVTTYGYDPRGNRASVTDALKNKTQFQYDARNRLTKITRPDQTTISYAYDGRGRLASVTDENNKITQYAYDDADRLVSVTDANNGVTQYAYDTENNLTGITDALLHTTSFVYDTQRRLTQTTFPSTKFETYGYDAVGNMTSKTDRKLQTISYTYDELNRLTKKQYPNTTTVNYTYDVASRLTQLQDASGTYTFAYDNMDRLTSASNIYSALSSKTFSISYGYDAGSNRTGLTDPNNSSISYTYDVLNRLATLKDFNRNSFTFGYDALSRTTSIARPNKVNTSYNYDALSNLLSVLHQNGTTTLDGASYAYDLAGNRTSKTNKLNSLVSAYSYDNSYELTGVTQGASTQESYSYDAVGNRLTSLSSPSYSYNSSDEMLSGGSASYTYDDNGNTLTKTDSTGVTTYAWDFENRLTSVTPPAGTSVTFRYDPMGRRIQKGTSLYIYDGANLIQESDSTGALVARYIQLGIDQPLAAYRGSASEFYESDGQGSITSLSTTSGSINQTYVFDSFGNTASTTGTFVQPFRYTGREWDNETGLYYYRARYYDSTVGHFVSEDPLGFGGGINSYRYVSNKVTLLTDPSGLANYLLLVGQQGLGPHNVGNSFNLAAQTYYNQLVASGDTATIVHVADVQDMAAALVSNGYIDGGVAYFGHAGVEVLGQGTYASALFLGQNPGEGTNLTFQNIAALSGSKMGPNASFKVFACNAGSFGRRSIAQFLANQLKHGVYAYSVGMFFTGNPNAMHSTPGSMAPGSLPVYMVPEGGGSPIGFRPQ